MDDLVLSPSYVYVCVTDGEQDQPIISNYDPDNPDLPFRGMSASSKEIRIWGTKTKSSYVPIEHDTIKNEWTTVFVEWSNHEGSFHVNGKKKVVGVFTCKDELEMEGTVISIGGTFDGSHSLKGGISTLEIYIVGKTRGDDNDGVPDGLKNLIISRQLICIATGEPPMQKKKI